MSNPGLLIFRVMVGLLLAVVLLVTSLILAPDEAPSELSNAMRTQGLSAVDIYAEGFTYQLGLGAPLGIDPAQYGATRIAAYQDALANSEDPTFQYAEKIQANVLPLLSTKEWEQCPLETSTCIKALLQDELKLTRLIEQSAELFRRYQHYLRLQGHQNTLLNRFDAPSDYSQYVTQGNFALRFRALNTARQGDEEGATEMLLADISRHRELMTAANTLLAKIVSNQAVINDLTLLNALQAWGLAAPSEAIPAMTQSELGFAAPIAWEFGSYALLFDDLSENRNAFSHDFKVPMWVVHSALKKNMFLNQLAQRMDKFIENSTRGPDEFSVEDEPSEITALGLLFNPVGTAFVRMTDETNYNHYSARTQDLRKQIVLFNQTIQSGHPQSDTDEAALGFRSAGEGKICFDRFYQSQNQSKDICLLMQSKRSTP